MKSRHAFWTSLCLASVLFLWRPTAGTAEEAPSLNPLNAIGKVTLKSFVERPLFDPSRRLPPVAPPPPAVVETPVAAPPEPPPTLHLLGVIYGARDIAVVRRDGEEKAIVLRSGDHVGAWSVRVLPSVGIRLHDGSRSFDYAMFSKHAGATQNAVAQDNFSGKMELSEAMAARNARLKARTY